MGRRINARPLGVTTLYDPLNLMVSQRVAGGQLTQIYNETTNSFTPSRAVTPLLLEVVAEGSVTATRETVQPILQGIVWTETYEDELGEHTATVATLADGEITATSDYALTASGRLLVMKDVMPSQPVTIRWKARWTDPRNGEGYTQEGQWTLTSDRVAEPMLRVVIEDPVRHWNPLSSANVKSEASGHYEVVIEARAMQGENDVTARARFFWYYTDETGAQRLVDDADHPSLAYISGQDTARLTVDPDFESDRQSYVCMAGLIPDGGMASDVTEPLPFALATASVSWQMPRTEGFVYSPQGRSVRNPDSRMTFMQKFRQGDDDLDEAKVRRRVVQHWKMKRDNRSTEEYLGAMPEVTVDGHRLASNDRSRMVVGADNIVLSPYVAVADADGNVACDADGAVVVGRCDGETAGSE